MFVVVVVCKRRSIWLLFCACNKKTERPRLIKDLLMLTFLFLKKHVICCKEKFGFWILDSGFLFRKVQWN